MLILFGFLSYFLFNTVRELLKKRQDRITTDREQSIADKNDAMKLKNEYDEKIKNVEKDAELILSNARKKAIKNEERINDEAELEKKKAADDIKKQIISVATLMAGKVVAVSVDEKTQDTLIEETLRE